MSSFYMIDHLHFNGAPLHLVLLDTTNNDNVSNTTNEIVYDIMSTFLISIDGLVPIAEEFIEIEIENTPPKKIPIEVQRKYIRQKLYNKKTSFNDTCCVCLSKFRPKQRLSTITKCKHSFCVQCLKKWINSNKSRQCPLCRTPIFNNETLS
ncbi:ring finger protein [Hemileuca sp. nucleopolyhedrovirus]|uniref:Ring finger protein n=1 Tax=Hemileuca sp. nucleopolyhedrovirus TaxID=1367203 RepID=S5MK43_9ABAC|nr:ring finger protein [Hemileuca sp. nucleopolyhedrovirus]AGR56831.1 ring finger protein [Hemileuca sp. nucleopolyhedrovirus]